jgi:hypothetical protein
VLAEVPGVGSVSAGTTDPAAPPTVTVAASEPGYAVTSTAGVLSVAAKGLSIEVSGQLTGRLAVRLALPEPPPDAGAVPGVLHVGDDGAVHKEPGLYDPQTNTVVVLAAAFTDRFGAWYDPRNWVEEAVQASQGVWDFVADWMTGRTDPPPCRKNAPSWMSVSSKELSSVHVCTQSNEADDGIAELYLKGNRNTLQVVTVPATSKAYVWVEDQNDFLRLFMPSFAHVDPATHVVLIGGGAMSIGFPRPEFDTEFQMRVFQTWPLVVANPLAGLMGGIQGNELEALVLAAASCTQEVTGLDSLRLDVVPEGFESPQTFFGSMAKCALELVTNPEILVSGADQVLVKMGLSASERNKIIARARVGVDAIGPTAKKLAGALTVGGALTQAWDGVFDNLAEGLVTGRLAGTAVTNVVTTAPVTAGGAAQDGLKVEVVEEAATCSAASNAVGDAAAYRCFAGHGVYDPCWAHTSEGRADEVLCQLKPWESTVYRLRSDGPLPVPDDDGKPDQSFPWGLELTTGDRCLAAQGSRSLFGERPVDFGCDPGNLEVLRGIGRRTGVWTVDAVTYNEARSGYEKAGSRQVKTAWYGDSGQPAMGWRDSLTAATVRRSLQDFLDAWRRGDETGVAQVSTAKARDSFDSDPGAWDEARLNWSSECALSDGGGICSVTLISPEGGGFAYQLVYEAVLGPQILITDAYALGGGM